MGGDMDGRTVKINKDKCIIKQWVDDGKISKWMCYYDEIYCWCDVAKLFGVCRWRI